MNRMSPGSRGASRPKHQRRQRVKHTRVAGATVAAIVAALSLAGCSSSNSPAGSSTSSTTVPASTGAPTTTSGSLSPAEQLYDKAIARVMGASSVHFVATSKGASSSGSTQLRFVADVSLSSGTLVGTWSSAGEQGQFTIVVIGAATYLKADADTLATFFGAMPATDASTYASKWISFATGDTLYSSLREDMTLASVTTSLKFQADSEHAVSGGLIELTGLPLSSTSTPAGEKASTTMTISSTTDLPLTQEFTATDNGATDSSAITFSNWNSAAVAVAPSGALTWASVNKAIAPTTTAAS